MKLFDVEWKTSLRGAGWHVRMPDSSEVRQFLFSRYLLLLAPRNVRGANCEQRFRRLVSNNDFDGWWREACVKDSDDKVFLLRFPRRAWEIPWELLLKDLQTDERRPTINFIRTDRYDPIRTPSHFDKPLRILVLQGDDGKKDGAPLDLKLEAEQIISAYKTLDRSIQRCIDPPIIENVSPDNLTDKLNIYAPHVLWFSGHGSANPDQTLCLDGPSWISAAQFARLISEAKQKPIYAIFWACDTGQVEGDRRTRSIPNIPALYKELTGIGVNSIVAMQAPIRDVSARMMASDLMRFLAAGYSLESAVAWTRANMISSSLEGAHPLDWVCPVVWSCGQIIDRLVWNAQAQHLAQLQLVGRQIIRVTSHQGNKLSISPSDTELFLANTWAAYRRLWVVGQGEADSAEQQYRWVRILQALQVQSARGILAVDLMWQPGHLEAGLKFWASQILAWLSASELDDDIAEALFEIKNDPVEAGWAHLCSVCKNQPTKFCLAIYGPPNYEPASWFWQPLLDIAGTDDVHVIVLSDEHLGNYEIERDWQLESNMKEMDERILAEVLGEQPRIARAMAVLNTPVRTDFIEASGLPFRNWDNRDSVIINTQSGPILTASARRLILDQITAEDLRLAHEDCAKILVNPQLDVDTSIREQRAEHCAKAGWTQEALLEVKELCLIYWQKDNPYSILTLIERTELHPFDLPSTALLYVAWAHLRLGEVQEAEFYLEETVPHDALDIAWKKSMQSEMNKSRGDKQAALNKITDAINICTEALKNAQSTKQLDQLALISQRLWGYRQDRARILQYLFYEKEQAKEEYESLLSNKPPIRYAGDMLDVAIAKRNYAECLNTLATDITDERWVKARQVLAEAEHIAHGQEQAPILAEILYEKARMAEREGKLSVAADYLVDCQQAARKSRHFMMATIAANRLFWKTEPFTLGRWKQLEHDLERFPYHGWAVRALIDSRIRASRRLELIGDLTGALTELEANSRDLQRSPAFQEGSDRYRIAETSAGLHIMKSKLNLPSSHWSEFRDANEWSTIWLGERKAIDAEDVWKGVN